MDEKNMMNEEIIEEEDRVQNEAEQNTYSDTVQQRVNSGETVKDVLTSPEGGFFGFAFTLVIGFVVYAFTRNGYHAKVKNPNGTEVTVVKEDEEND